jgi:hypothetical protein
MDPVGSDARGQPPDRRRPAHQSRKATLAFHPHVPLAGTLAAQKQHPSGHRLWPLPGPRTTASER